MSYRGTSYSADLDIPSDMFALVLQMFVAGKYRFVLMEAEVAVRGEAIIHYYRFSGTLAEDELPPSVLLEIDQA